MKPIHDDRLVKVRSLFPMLFIIFITACANPDSLQVEQNPTPTAPSITTDYKTADLNIFNPSSPTMFNPYLTDGVKDFEPSRIVYEPLASFNNDGMLIPILAAEIPSFENGAVAADGKSVIWNLRRDVRWSDGKPFTADDVKFTYDYIIDPKVKSNVTSEYSQISNVEALGKFTVRITFSEATPAWALPFVGIRGVILPRHIFESYKGANAHEAPANLMPVGTGSYRVKEPGIKPQEIILLGSQMIWITKTIFEPNPYYRFPDKIAFNQIIWNGGGDINAAKSQLLEDKILDVVYQFEMVKPTQLSELFGNDSKAKLISAFVPGVNQIYLNRTDPYKPSADGEYSSLEVPHPFFSDKVIRQAVAYAINRDALAALYGVIGKPAYTTLIDPPQYRSTDIFYRYDLKKANALLDNAGYVDGNSDGFREKDGIKIKVVFMTSVNPILQQEQKIIQKNLEEIGIDVALKTVDPSILFGDNTTNPDSEFRFNADMMIFRQRSLSPDPGAFMQNWTCAKIPQKSNNWLAGNNDERWCNPEYDALLQKANIELDPAKRQKMFIQLNDILIEDVVMIPTVWSASALGVNQNLMGIEPTPWDSLTWNIQDWYFAQP